MILGGNFKFELFQLEKKAALEAEEAEKKEKAAAAEKLEEVVEEECKKVSDSRNDCTGYGSLTEISA